jgi:hypothetical protein
MDFEILNEDFYVFSVGQRMPGVRNLVLLEGSGVIVSNSTLDFPPRFPTMNLRLEKILSFSASLGRSEQGTLAKAMTGAREIRLQIWGILIQQQ